MQFPDFLPQSIRHNLTTLIPFVYCAAAQPAHAAFTLIDDFQARQTGAIDGQGDWQARSAKFVVTSDPTVPTNQVLCLSPEPTAHAATLPLILDHATSTLFFRLQRTVDWAFSATTGSAASQLADLAALDQTGDITITAARPGGATSIGVAANTWTNFWLVFHTGDKTSELWAAVDNSQTPQYQVLNDANGNGEFRFGTNEGQNKRLFNLLITLGNDAQGLTYIDDLYLDDASANLTSPIPMATTGDSAPEPTVATLVSTLGTLALLRRRR